MDAKTIRVMLVDNEEVFREGLNSLFNEQPHIEVVYQCDNSKDAIKISKEVNPDIVLVNGHLSEGKILDTITEISQSSPESRVVLISRSEVEATPVDVLKAGAKACLSRDISAADMVKSIELISSGRIIISPIFVQRFLDELPSAKTESPEYDGQDINLSEREMEIARLVAQGASNKEIAEALFISESTTKVHVKHILNKLELKNRQQLAVYAVLQNWVKNSKNFDEQDFSSNS